MMENNTHFSIRKKGIIEIVFLIFIVCIVLIHTLRYLHINIDDKYIIYKYAQNLANGYGLCFNKGQRVEGFTSLLYVIILSIFIKIGNLLNQSEDTLITITVIGRIFPIIATVLTPLYLYFFLRHCCKFSFVAVSISILLLVLRPDFIISSTNGLETGIFILFFTSFNVHLLSINKNKDKGIHKWMAAIFGSLTCLSRADGFFYVFTTLVIWLILIPNKQRSEIIQKQQIYLPFSLIIITSLAYFGFRLWYFGEIFPNTFYTKMNFLNEKIISLYQCPPIVINGWERIPLTFQYYVWPCVSLVVLFYALLLLLPLSSLINKLFPSLKTNRYFNLLTKIEYKIYLDKNNLNVFLFSFISFILFIFYTLYVGGDWMPGYRIIMHYFPFPFVICCSFIFESVKQIIKEFKEDIIISYSLIFFLLIIYGNEIIKLDKAVMTISRYIYEFDCEENIPTNHGFYFLRGGLKKTKKYLSYCKIVEALKSRLKKGDCFALYEIGCISFQLGTDYNIVDLSSLNEPTLSKLHNVKEGYRSVYTAFIYIPSNMIRGFVDKYILSKRPKFIILDSVTLIEKEYPSYILGNQYRINFSLTDCNSFVVYEKIFPK